MKALELLGKARKKSNDKGFTLVELIVVLVILAILAAILVPALLGYIDRARNSQTLLNAKSCLTAAQAEMSSIYGAGKTPSEIEKRKSTVLSTADVPTIEKLVVGTDVASSGSVSATSANHKAFTITYVEYKDDKGTAFFDGSTWFTDGTKISAKGSTYTIK